MNWKFDFSPDTRAGRERSVYTHVYGVLIENLRLDWTTYT